MQSSSSATTAQTSRPPLPEDNAKKMAIVLGRLMELLYCAGDAECPHRESAALCFDALQRWQRHEIGGAVRRLGWTPRNGGSQLRCLKVSFRAAWRTHKEAERAALEEKKAEDGADYAPDTAASGKPDDADDGADDAAEDEVLEDEDDEEGDADGSAAERSQAEQAQQRAEFMRLQDERTEEMSCKDYQTFHTLRAFQYRKGHTSLRQYLRAFGELTAHNLRGIMPLATSTGAAAGRDGTSSDRSRGRDWSATLQVVRLLAQLWADKAAELVEAANRDVHGGVLAIAHAPLEVRAYAAACEQLVARVAREEEAAELPASRKREQQPPGAASSAKRQQKPSTAAEGGGSWPPVEPPREDARHERPPPRAMDTPGGYLMPLEPLYGDAPRDDDAGAFGRKSSGRPPLNQKWHSHYGFLKLE